MEDRYHQKQDRQSLLAHQIIFNDERRVDTILQEAKAVLDKWIKLHEQPDCTPSPYWRSWRLMLENCSFEEVKAFALADTDLATAHRQSSPFSVLLSKEQVRQIRSRVKDEFKTARALDILAHLKEGDSYCAKQE